MKAIGLLALLIVQWSLLLFATLHCVHAQWWMWTSVVELAPSGSLLFASLYYFPVLLVPTACWWLRVLLCKIEDWPMPKLSGLLLLLLWMPLVFTPVVVIVQIVMMFVTVHKLWNERKS